MKIIKNIKNGITLLALAAIIIVVLPLRAQATFQLTVDGRNIDFGLMRIGEEKELKEKGPYHNEITCQSDNGNMWYLKVHLLTPFESGEHKIEPSNFKWRVVEIQNGNGVVTNEGKFNNFALAPNIVYISGPDDTSGRLVKIRFSYGLEISKGVISGNYRAYIRYTLSETL